MSATVTVAAVIYAACWLATTRAVALRVIDRVAQVNLRSRQQMARSYRPEDRDRVIADQGPLVGSLDRREAITDGMFLGAVWWLYWAARGVGAVLDVVPMKSPTELAEEERRELVALRQLAREHDLPMPGEG